MTARSPSRRDFLRVAGATSLSGLAQIASGAASGNSKRAMTMDLVCGNLGVKADLPTAIALAHAHGFESVAPDAGYLGRLSDGQLTDLLGELKTKGLTWGAAGLPVDFRGDDTSFRAGMIELPAFASALKRAGASRVGTWLRPAPRPAHLYRQFPAARPPPARGGGYTGKSWAAPGAGVRRSANVLGVGPISVYPHAGGDTRTDRRDRPRQRRTGAR